LYFLPLPQGQGSFLCGFMSVALPSALTRRGCAKIHSWFESLTTNGFQVAGFKHLAVRPFDELRAGSELRRRATAIFHSFSREKGLIRRAPLPPERHRRRLNSTDVLYSLVKIRPLLGEVLSFEAYRVNFFFAEIKKLRALDVVKGRVRRRTTAPPARFCHRMGFTPPGGA
jgi:hypothetical protein